MTDADSTLERGQLYRVAWIFYLCVAVAGLVWIGWREGSIEARLFFDRQRWWEDALIGLAAGIGLVALWEVGRRLLPAGRQLEHELRRLLGPLEPAEVVALAVLSGVAEEVFFRGAVQGSWGWLPATLLFALLHTGPGPAFRAWTVFAAVAGLALAGLMLWRGALLAPILAHFTVNAVNLGRLVRDGATEVE